MDMKKKTSDFFHLRSPASDNIFDSDFFNPSIRRDLFISGVFSRFPGVLDYQIDIQPSGLKIVGPKFEDFRAQNGFRGFHRNFPAYLSGF